MVEAAGIEPMLPTNPNPMMANEFGFHRLKTIQLRRRFFPVVRFTTFFPPGPSVVLTGFRVKRYRREVNAF